MTWLKELLWRLRQSVGRRDWERELSDEMEFHVSQETAENIARGMDPAEARRKALADFGGIERHKEWTRDEGGFRLLEELWHDFRFACRQIRRYPTFAAVVIATLALAVGLNSAIFGIVDGVLLRPLPFNQSERLVEVRGAFLEEGSTSLGLSWADFVDLRQRNESFDRVAIYRRPFEYAVATGDAPPVLRSMADAGLDLDEVLRVRPYLGRYFSEEEFLTEEPTAVLISYDFWQQLYGSDPGVVGRTLKISGADREIVGVMPPGFDFPGGADLWEPQRERPVTEEDNISADGFGRDWRNLLAVARLNPGVTLEQANAELALFSRQQQESYPKTNSRYTIYAADAHEHAVGDLRTPLLALQAAVGLILLIACVNVANLLLARGKARAPELATRVALGGGRGRLMRQLLTESLVLALLGGAAGVVLGSLTQRLLLAGLPAQWLASGQVNFDLRVVAAMLATVAAAGLAFGIMPAWQAGKSDPQQALSGVRQTGGLGKHRLQRALVVAEVALSTVLVVGAALFSVSLRNQLAQDPGFEPEKVLTVRVAVQPPKYRPWEDYRRFFNETVAAVRQVPGVASAALSFNNPMEPDGDFMVWFQLPGILEDEPGDRPTADIRPVSTDFFQTVGIPLVAGRDFTDADGREAPGVVVVNETFVRRFLPERDPLGVLLVKNQFWGHDYPAEHTIVGVVGDTRASGYASDPLPAMYFPYNQTPFGNMRILARTAGDPMALAPAVREAVWSIDSEIPLERMTTLANAVSQTVAGQRYANQVLGGFAALALALAAVGLYGVMAYGVAERTREIGLRQALGADRGDILRLVVRQGARLTAIGLVLGVALSLAAGRLITGMLYGVAPGDPRATAVVALVVGLVSLAAVLLPARRAAALDPMAAIREE